MSEKDYVEVTVRVPKRLMRLLEDQNYFGWSKEEFFTVCVRRGVSCEITALGIDDVRQLERKYGKQAINRATVVYSTTHKKLS